jgi:predicted permease
VLDISRQDASYAARALARSPLFTVIAVISVAIGVGATTAIATISNTLLLRPPPGVGAPDRLVNLGRTQEGNGFDNFSYPNFVDYRDGTRTLTGLAAMQVEPLPLSLATPNGGEPVHGSIVSGNFFAVLQTRPSRGRFFLPEEDQVPAARPVVVLSHAFWRERFEEDTAIVGRTIVLNGSPFTVVGVAADGFRGPFVIAPDLWVPVMSGALVGRPASLVTERRAVWLMAIGRLAPNASVGAAQAELGAIAHRLEQSYPEANRGQGVRVTPASVFPGDLRKAVGGFMALLFAVAGLVLLIAGMNVAGMLLARAAARSREIAVRLALGASRGRLVRQLVTESLLLFLVAGAAGLLLAHWLVAALMTLVPRLPFQLAVDPQLDWRVLLFALAISLGSGLVAGLVPALQSTRPALLPALKSDAGVGGSRQRLRSALLVTQIAFSMLLLITAGLFARALVHARSIDPGFDARDVHLASLDLELASYDAARGLPLAATLRERARQLPGVQSAALSAMLPLDGGGLGLGGIDVAGTMPPDPRRGWDADWNVVTPGYFDVLRMPIVRGRDFSGGDREGTPDVAILNETFARRLWPGEDPIGRTFRNEERTVTVVGIARDAKYRSLGEDPRNFVYVPLAQRYFTRTTLLVRTTPGVQVAASVRRIVADLDRSLPILDQRPLEEHAATALFPQRLALLVAGSLGVVALLLALLGIYGVTAYSVARRTREIGIRIALGAPRSNVVRLVLRQGVLLAALGVAMGSAAAFGVTRLLAAVLYGVPPTDAIAFAGAATLLVLAAVVAGWIPARRAAAVDPVVALRAE